MLDNQKYQKYFAKRKLLAQYEQEMRAEKRNRMDGDCIDDEMDTNNADDDNNRPLNMRRSQSTTEDENRSSTATTTASDNGRNSVGLNLIQNIKKEKGDDIDGGHTDVNGNDDEMVTGGNVGFYGTHMSKLKHSILEPNIVLQHSDEVMSPSNGAPTNSITSTLQNNNTNLSQKTAS